MPCYAERQALLRKLAVARAGEHLTVGQLSFEVDDEQQVVGKLTLGDCREGVKPYWRGIRVLRGHEHSLLGAELRHELLQHREALGDDLGVLRQPGGEVSGDW